MAKDSARPILLPAKPAGRRRHAAILNFPLTVEGSARDLREVFARCASGERLRLQIVPADSPASGAEIFLQP